MAVVDVVLTVFGILQTTWSAELFDPLSEICCSGAVHQLPVSRNSSHIPTSFSTIFCCGKDMYDSTTHMCCLNNVIARPLKSHANALYSCCGSNIFDAATSLCCDGTAIDLNHPPTNHSTAKLPTEDAEILGNSVDRKLQEDHLVCCGPEVYDWRMDMCCSTGGRGRKGTSVIERPSPHSECCGGQAYDIRKEMCCSDKIQPAKDENLRLKLFCCGQNAYNPSVAVCCDGNKVLNKPEADQQYVCCGDNLQLKSAEMCCDNAVVEIPLNDTAKLKCCGSSTYDPESELCCNGVKHSEDNVETKCCGTDIYKPNSGEICCGNVVQRPPNNRNANSTRINLNLYPVCCGDSILADPRREMCCDGHVIARTSNRARCCGSKVIDGDRNICCKGKIKAKMSSNDGCCGDDVYDTSHSVCCYENNEFKVIERERNRSACCCQPAAIADFQLMTTGWASKKGNNDGN